MSFGKGLYSLFQPSRGGTGETEPPKILHTHEGSSAETVPPRRIEHPQPKQESVFHIEVEKIKPNPYQPRKNFNETGLEELTCSVREFGVLQPIVVSKIVKESDIGTHVEYQLIAGERRLMAAKRAGHERIPAIVRNIDVPKMKLELSLIENLQRTDLGPLEAARAYERLQNEFGLTQKEVAARVGKSREAVANTLRLLNLPPYIQEAITEGKISESHARHFLSLPPSEQKAFFEKSVSEGFSVRQVREKIVSQKNPDPERGYLERKLEERFGTPASVIKQGGRGKITLQFFSEEEFRALIRELLKGEEME